MPKRKPTEIAHVGLRLRERLRAELERAAKKHGVSLNAEMVDRLQRTLTEDAAAGGTEIRNMERFMGAAFLHGGQAGARGREHPDWEPAQWIDDPYCYDAAAQTVNHALVAMEPELEFSDDTPREAREIGKKLMHFYGRQTSRTAILKAIEEEEDDEQRPPPAPR